MFQRFVTNAVSAFAGVFGGLAIWRGTQHNWASMVFDIVLCLGWGTIAVILLRQEHKKKGGEP